MIFAHLSTAQDSSRETKNTIRYSENTGGKPPAIGTLYVQMWLLGNKPPKNLTVTIADSDSGK